MERYGVSYITNVGSRGSSVIEADKPLTNEQIKNAIDQKLEKDGFLGHKVDAISVTKMTPGATLASKLLIKAANIFLK